MPGLLENIGSTNTLSAVTGNIANRAIDIREQGLRDRELAVTEANAKVDRDIKREKQAALNKPVPIESIQQAFPIKPVADYAHKVAKSLGYVEDIDGVPVIRAGNAKKVLEYLQEGDNPQIISSLTTQHYRSGLQQTKEQMAAYTAKNPAKDLSNDKQYLALAQQAQQQQQGLMGALEQADQLKTYSNYIKQGYAPGNVQKAMESGDLSMLGEPISESSKLIERTIDLGDKQRVVYTDGTQEDIPKAASPSTVVMANSKTPDAEMKMRKEFLTLPEVKEYPTIASQALRLDKAMEEAKTSKSLVAVDQALITILNKMLDPTSVVRESEYARTPSDQALLSRVKGKFEKLKSGGAGLTSDERTAIYDMAQRFKEVAEQQYNAQADYYSDLATRYGYNPENVLRLGGKRVGSQSGGPKTADEYLSNLGGQ